MLRRLLQTLAFVMAIGTVNSACSVETVRDLSVTQTVEIDFHALDGDIPSQTRRGDIVFDLRNEADFVGLEAQLRCVGLDPFASNLTVSRLEAEGLDSILDFRVEIAPHPNGDWVRLADFTSLVTDQSMRSFADTGFTIYIPGLDVLEAVAFSDTPQYELRVTSTVPDAVMALEVQLDMAVVFSSQAGACPSP